jgi:hypothetical protein
MLSLQLAKIKKNFLSRLGLCPDTFSGELRSCSTLGAYPQDKFDLPTSL